MIMELATSPHAERDFCSSFWLLEFTEAGQTYENHWHGFVGTDVSVLGFHHHFPRAPHPSDHFKLMKMGIHGFVRSCWNMNWESDASSRGWKMLSVETSCLKKTSYCYHKRHEIKWSLPSSRLLSRMSTNSMVRFVTEPTWNNLVRIKPVPFTGQFLKLMSFAT